MKSEFEKQKDKELNELQQALTRDMTGQLQTAYNTIQVSAQMMTTSACSRNSWLLNMITLQLRFLFVVPGSRSEYNITALQFIHQWLTELHFSDTFTVFFCCKIEILTCLKKYCLTEMAIFYLVLERIVWN